MREEFGGGKSAPNEAGPTPRRFARLTLNPDDISRVDLLLNRLGKEQVGLTVREPVGLVKLDLARVVCCVLGSGSAFRDGSSSGAHSPVKESERRTVEEGPEDRVGKAVVVPFGDFSRQVDGDTGELGLEFFRDEFAVDFGNVKACRRRARVSSRGSGGDDADRGGDVAPGFCSPGHPIHCR